MRSALGVAVAALLLTATACSDDEPARASHVESPDLATGEVSCPQVTPEKQQNVDFRRTDPEAPRIDALLSILPLGSRTFCAEAVVFDPSALAERIVSYELTLPGNRANYGEHYGTTDADGSEELLNFPFAFVVHGPCRDVTAEIVVRSGGADHRYRAETVAGPKCGDG